MFSSREEMKNTFVRSSVNFILLPYKAFLSLKAVFVTLYRMVISKKKMLEWVTAADAEKMLGNAVRTYAKEMMVGPVIGLALAITTLVYNELMLWQVAVLFAVWYAAPFLAFHISKNISKKDDEITSAQKDEILELARRTWAFFDEYISEENNFLMIDNFDENRKEQTTPHTSSTNIGLSLLAVVSAYNLGFIKKGEMVEKVNKIVGTIENLDKWNGHLYNWYDVKSLKPLKPEFVSTVDSGNFVGYLFTLKGFFEDEDFCDLKNRIGKLIENTDFAKLYDFEKNLFSIGFDVSANKLVDSYYDLLASEARLASFVAIAKNDILYKHWFCLGRTFAKYGRMHGLVSWSGTMFEYFMPNVIMENYEDSLIKNSCDFVTYSQQKYAEKLKIPWGISESAFALKDLKYNYQYKAFGVPWLALKRGTYDEVVVSPYSSIMALDCDFAGVMKNISKLKMLDAYDKFGFYDAIDFTPARVQNKKREVVKNYMAHHQALILLSINNFLNEDILKKYFAKNAEVRKTEILLQEKFPMSPLFANEKKDTVKKLKYQEFDEVEEEFTNKSLENVNILTNNEYTLLVCGNGDGYSKIGDIFVTKFKENQRQSNILYVKNLGTNEFWSTAKSPAAKVPDEYGVSFSSHDAKFYRKDGNIETSTEVLVSAEENVEIRRFELRNTGEDVANLSVISYTEFILSTLNADIVHPAYNSMFQSVFELDGTFVLEKRFQNGEKIFATFFAVAVDVPTISFECECDKVNFVGRCNGLENPVALTDGTIFLNKFVENVNPIISLKSHVRLDSKESVQINYFLGVAHTLEEISEIINKYKVKENENRLLELAKSRALIENRFYDLKKNKISLYNKLLFEIFNGSDTRKKFEKKIFENTLSQRGLWKFGVSGDVPIILANINNVNDVYVICELVDAIRYFNLKNLKIDLVVLNKERGAEKYVYDSILRYVNSKNIAYLLGAKGGIHIIDFASICAQEENLFYAACDVVLNAKDGFLKEQLGGANGK